MLKQRHEHEACAKTNRSLVVAEGRRTAAGCSSQQAAAAWAWFEHGGSTCITPSKAEGLMAAKRNANCSFSSTVPSRFKKEVLSSNTAIPQHSAGTCDDIAIANGHARRRYSSHNDDLAKHTSVMWRFSRSCRSASPRFNIDKGADQDEGKDQEVGGNTSSQDIEASSLLDKFEVEALCRQVHDHLSSSGSTPSSTCSAELQEYYKADHHVNNPLPHLKPPRYFKSSDTHKPLADNEPRLRIKMSTRSSRSNSTAPAFCSSIAIADSIVDHHHRHHPASPKQFRSVPPINQTSKRQELTIHGRRNKQNTGRISDHSGKFKRNQLLETTDEASAATGEHERGEFASSHCNSQQKTPGRSDLELIGGARPGKMHHSDLICNSKVLQPLMSGLQHMNSLLGHGAPPTEDGVVQANRHRHFHHHIHHHHHHYHHLEHIHQASQDAVLLDHLITKIDDCTTPCKALQIP